MPRALNPVRMVERNHESGRNTPDDGGRVKRRKRDREREGERERERERERGPRVLGGVNFKATLERVRATHAAIRVYRRLTTLFG